MCQAASGLRGAGAHCQARRLLPARPAGPGPVTAPPPGSAPGIRSRARPEEVQGQHVPFPGEPLVGLLDVGLAGAPADPQHAVRVEFARRGRSQRRQQQQEQEAGGPCRLHGPAGPRAEGADGPPSRTQRRRFRRARPPSPWRPSASGTARPERRGEALGDRPGGLGSCGSARGGFGMGMGQPRAPAEF